MGVWTEPRARGIPQEPPPGCAPGLAARSRPLGFSRAAGAARPCGPGERESWWEVHARGSLGGEGDAGCSDPCSARRMQHRGFLLLALLALLALTSAVAKKKGVCGLGVEGGLAPSGLAARVPSPGPQEGVLE